MRTQLKEYAGW